MTNKEKVKVLKKALLKIMEESPDLRIGQIISNFISESKIDIYYIKDKDLIKAIKENE